MHFSCHVFRQVQNMSFLLVFLKAPPEMSCLCTVPKGAVECSSPAAALGFVFPSSQPQAVGALVSLLASLPCTGREDHFCSELFCFVLHAQVTDDCSQNLVSC